MKKIRTLIVLLTLALLAGCNKTESEPASISESVASVSTEEQSEVSVSEPEEAEEEDEEEAEEEAEEEEEVVYYHTMNELADGICKRTWDASRACGAIDEDELLFYVSAFEDTETLDPVLQFSVGETWDAEYAYVSFNKKGVRDTFITSVTLVSDENGVKVTSFKIDICESYAKKFATDEKGRVVSAYLSGVYEAPFKKLRTYSPELRDEFMTKIMADGTVNRDTTVWEYVYDRTEDKEIFKDPVKLTKYLFPFLEDKELKWVETTEETGFVAFIDENGTHGIEYKCFKKTEDGENLYTLSTACYVEPYLN